MSKKNILTLQLVPTTKPTTTRQTVRRLFIKWHLEVNSVEHLTNGTFEEENILTVVKNKSF